MRSSSALWGQHLILDLNGCDRQAIGDPDTIKHWIKELVEAIGMQAYGEPLLEHFATHNYESAGYTLVQLIETSNICAHFAENLGQAYIDIFSCREFDVNTAESVCHRFFSPTHVVKREIDRGDFGEHLAEAG